MYMYIIEVKLLGSAGRGGCRNLVAEIM